MMSKRRAIASIMALIIVCASFGAQAQTLDQRLLALAVSLGEARKDLQASDQQSLQDLSSVATHLESVINEARNLSRSLNSERESAEELFFEESKNLTEILSFLAVVENAPAPDFLLHPDGPLAAARADLILDAVLPDIRSSLSGIAGELANWRELQAQDAMLRDTTNAALNELNQVRAGLLDVEPDPDGRRLVADPMALDQLYAVSESLDGFIEGVSRLNVSGDAPSTDFQYQSEKFTYPVSGGPVRKGDGVAITTNDFLVKAPFTATIRFGADFLDYGKIAILEPSRDVMVVIAGLDELTVEEGEIVKAGDVIGFFTVADGENSDNDLETIANELYLETRIRTAPVDSTKYFRTHNGTE